MLTDSEREWLNHRNIAHPDGDYFCELCDVFAECHMYWPIECPTKLSIKPEDIAFEARVAAKLAERCVLLEKVVQKVLGAAEYINLSAAAENALKAARLQVEEEMDE